MTAQLCCGAFNSIFYNQVKGERKCAYLRKLEGKLAEQLKRNGKTLDTGTK